MKALAWLCLLGCLAGCAPREAGTHQQRIAWTSAEVSIAPVAEARFVDADLVAVPPKTIKGEAIANWQGDGDATYSLVTWELPESSFLDFDLTVRNGGDRALSFANAFVGVVVQGQVVPVDQRCWSNLRKLTIGPGETRTERIHGIPLNAFRLVPTLRFAIGELRSGDQSGAIAWDVTGRPGSRDLVFEHRDFAWSASRSEMAGRKANAQRNQAHLERITAALGGNASPRDFYDAFECLWAGSKNNTGNPVRYYPDEGSELVVIGGYRRPSGFDRLGVSVAMIDAALDQAQAQAQHQQQVMYGQPGAQPGQPQPAPSGGNLIQSLRSIYGSR